jgi:hypothetical protein
MSSAEMRKMLRGVYVAREGARSVLGYMDRNITSSIADLVLNNDAARGDIEVVFDESALSIALRAKNVAREECAVARAI